MTYNVAFNNALVVLDVRWYFDVIDNNFILCIVDYDLHIKSGIRLIGKCQNQSINEFI